MDKDRVIANLCEALAMTEDCPYYTDEGCPRPDAKGRDRFDNGMCVKAERRSRFGAECWRLWAERKVD